MSEKKQEAKVDLKYEILKQVTRLGATYHVEAGIVFVRMPDGTVWDFTVPMEKGATS